MDIKGKNCGSHKFRNKHRTKNDLLWHQFAWPTLNEKHILRPNPHLQIKMVHRSHISPTFSVNSEISGVDADVHRTCCSGHRPISRTRCISTCVQHNTMRRKVEPSNGSNMFYERLCLHHWSLSSHWRLVYMRPMNHLF